MALIYQISNNIQEFNIIKNLYQQRQTQSRLPAKGVRSLDIMQGTESSIT